MENQKPVKKQSHRCENEEEQRSKDSLHRDLNVANNQKLKIQTTVEIPIHIPLWMTSGLFSGSHSTAVYPVGAPPRGRRPGLLLQRHSCAVLGQATSLPPKVVVGNEIRPQRATK